MLVPLTAIVTTSLPMAAAIALCSKDRKTVHAKNKNKSSKSAKSTKSARGRSSKSGKSSRSHRSKSQRSKRSSKSGKKGKSSKSGKGGKSGKSGKSSKSKKAVKGTATSSASAASGVSSASTAASEKSTKSSKSSRKSSKSSKSRKARRLDSDAQNKMEKSGKSTKTAIASGKLPQSTGGTQMAKSLVEEVNAIKHSNQLTVVPSKLQYQTLGGVNQIELKNTSGERKAYKVKCSDNALYRVNPVYGFAEPHSSVKIDVLRLNGEQKTDKLVLLTANAKDMANPHDAFAQQTEHREMMVVPLVAA
ncbi:hypothetical protein CAEBREN_03719 [Caenorhabditis brenneri]|uniref:Major sperm protein n=1 Tax=Caenorhabditis brenneri TaxID=135651 RepID=G0NXS5_CAEBE|nr:hypothetical protein CAEBREN_03719 [Caenorhabditis brenneri]